MSTRRSSASAQATAPAESVTPDPTGTKGEEGGASSAPDQPRIRKRRLDVNPNLIISEERSKRRRTPSPEPLHEGEDNKNGILDPKDPERAKVLGLQIYNKILAAKDSDGESMSQPFVKLPSKRAFPDYYETIKHPMSLEIVHGKLEKAEYNTLKEVCADLGQMFTNAKRYNVKESLLFQYAKKLHKTTRLFYAKTTQPQKAHEESDSDAEGDVGAEAEGDADADGDAEGEADDDAEGEEEEEEEEPAPAIETKASAKFPSPAVHPAAPSPVPAPLHHQHRHRASTGDGDGDGDMGGPSTGSVDGDDVGGKPQRKRGSYMQNGPSVYKLIKPVLKAIKEAKAKDGSHREIAAIFAQLPDRRDLPDYYTSIKNPISLEEIESKQLGRRYDTWQEFFEDVELMCKNAMQYNEDGSEVYRDAQQILSLLAISRRDVQMRIANPNAPKYKPRNSNLTPARAAYSSAPYTSHLSPTPLSYAHSAVPNPNYPPGPSAYPAGPSAPLTTGTYLPALPQGVVTEEVVASLDRYPVYEQQAWVQSLPPLAANVYRQMAMANEARKRASSAYGQPPTPIAAPLPTPQTAHAGQHQPYMPTSTLTPRHPALPSPAPSAGRTNGYPPTGIAGAPNVQSIPRQSPPVPTVKHLDFHFSAPGESPDLSQTVRLQNMRGVVTHCVILNSITSEVEITAYIADATPSSAKNKIVNGHHEKTTAGEGRSSASPADKEMDKDDNADLPSLSPSAAATITPEVSLRINGNQGSLPKFVFPPSISTLEQQAETERQPIGMKWTIVVPTNRMESKIEVVATKPGALAETSTIFVSRQL